MTSPCATCTLGCCRHYLVTVTGYDAWVIANGLRLAPEQFLVVVPQQKPNGRGFLLEPGGRSFEIALDKAASDDPEKPCVFWLELANGAGRCGIYPLRPQVCQTYPAFLNGAAVARRDDVLCPDDAWRDGVLAQPLWRERLLAMQVEFDIYALAVARWNYHVQHTPRPARIATQSYFDYLMNYYARLEPIRTQLGPAWQALSADWGSACMRGASPLAVPDHTMAPWLPVLGAIHTVAGSFFPDDRVPEDLSEVAA